MPYKTGTWGEQAKARSKNRNDYFKSRALHTSNLKRRYGITSEQYDQMLKKQKGLCAICKNKENAKSYNKQSSAPQRLAIDHCHKTGLVRGLLCFSCNRGIGYLKDDIKLLSNAIKYLQ